MTTSGHPDPILGTDAATAFRLTMDETGTAPAGAMLRAWNMLGRHADKRTIADLTPGFERHGSRIVGDAPLEPIGLGFDEALAEALRLSGEHRAPDAGGWHRMSDVARVMHMLVGARDPRAMGATHANVPDALRAHPGLESRRDRSDLLLRPIHPALATPPVSTLVLCPGDREPRTLADAGTFGMAFRALHGAAGPLVAEGTTATFMRGDETRRATWSQARRTWIAPDGRPLPRTDASDPVLHRYRNGHLVGGLVGFVSTSKTGAFFANVGTPHDSEGDEDALVAVVERAKAIDRQDAETMLTARDDLDHVFGGVQAYDRQMGFWLTAMREAEAT